MIRGAQLREMPKNHEFQKGDGLFTDLSPDPIRWVAVWSGVDWCLRVAPATKNFKEVATRGRIVDIMKIAYQILPFDSEAEQLYRK